MRSWNKAQPPNADARWRRPRISWVVIWATVLLTVLMIAGSVLVFAPLAGIGIFLPFIGLALHGVVVRRWIARRLAQRGRPGTGVIVGLRDTGYTVNDNPRVDIVLQVRPKDGSASFITVARELVSRLSIPKAGMTVPVLYDPGDPSLVTVVEPDHPRWAASTSSPVS
jgi:hypothetical protein